MKLRYSYVIILLALSAAVFAGTFLEYFQGHSDGEDIRLEWKTQEESNLKHFVVERKTPQSSFVDIATIQPKGSNSYYSYLDQSAYKIENILFVYRLRIVDNNGQVAYSNEVSISHSVSGVKRTWGSIKAMFR